MYLLQLRGRERRSDGWYLSKVLTLVKPRDETGGPCIDPRFSRA